MAMIEKRILLDCSARAVNIKIPPFGEYPKPGAFLSLPLSSSSVPFLRGLETMPRSDRDHLISVPSSAGMQPHSPPAKPKGGARVLSFVLQALVMAVALALFFLFAGVAAVVLLHLCVAGRALRRRRRLHSLSRHPANSAPAVAEPSGLSPAVLRELPCFEYSGGVSASPPWPPDCAVCLEGFRVGEWCRALPGCGHAFHAPCVDRWLVRSPACPICRRGVVVPVVPDRVIRRPVGWA